MKATGIVRRIDDLGRIVVPKEIRRTLRIRAVSYTHLDVYKRQSNGFSVYGTEVGNSENWYFAVIRDGCNYETGRGIRLGMTKGDVEAAYGKAYWIDRTDCLLYTSHADGNLFLFHGIDYKTIFTKGQLKNAD